MALLIEILKTIVAIAGLSLVGRFIVALFNWHQRHNNVVFQLFSLIAKPALVVVRRLSPRAVLDRHVPVAAFLLLLVSYFGLVLWQREECMSNLQQPGCERLAQARYTVAPDAVPNLDQVQPEKSR